MPAPVREHGCELCEARRMTPWMYEDEFCFVAECESCGVPMVVLREHRVEVEEVELERMLERLAEAAREFYGERRFFIDKERRQIPDHFHAHARPYLFDRLRQPG